jgi:hypothetical protein
MKAEEILSKHNVFINVYQEEKYNNDEFSKALIDAMEEYASIKQDELIEKICEESHKTNGISSDKVIFIEETVAGFNITEINFKDWLKSLK